MGFKFITGKFDDPEKRVSQSVDKVSEAFYNEAIRRAIQSISNRVICGINGTTVAGTSLYANVGTGATAGVAFANSMICAINGRLGTCTLQSNLYLPAGTQGSGTWVKYLIAGKFGTAATVVMGNEGTDSTSALLPDCPDGYAALGYLEYATTSGAFGRFGGGTAGGYNVVSGNISATCGTVINFTNLLHMPYGEN